MKIKKSDKLLTLENSKAKVLYALDQSFSDKMDADLILSNTKLDKTLKHGTVIDSPGEYETNDVFVYALSHAIQNVDLFSIDMDGMNIIIYNSDSDVTSLIDSEDIPENNILICNVGKDYSKINEVIDELEPNVVILTNTDGNEMEDILKKLSLVPSEKQTSYTYTEDNFENDEEKSMQILVLN